jgi:hypothetical protein
MFIMVHHTKNPSDKMIHNYMTSAAEAWKVLTGMMVPLLEDPKDGQQAELQPIVMDILNQHRNWMPTKEKRKPYTFEMFRALNDLLCKSVFDGRSISLQEQWAIFNWTRLVILLHNVLSRRMTEITQPCIHTCDGLFICQLYSLPDLLEEMECKEDTPLTFSFASFVSLSQLIIVI